MTKSAFLILAIILLSGCSAPSTELKNSWSINNGHLFHNAVKFNWEEKPLPCLQCDIKSNQFHTPQGIEHNFILKNGHRLIAQRGITGANFLSLTEKNQTQIFRFFATENPTALELAIKNQRLKIPIKKATQFSIEKQNYVIWIDSFSFSLDCIDESQLTQINYLILNLN
ncbi:hypothetical protein D5018_05970 [Parashewanella curva]|uniref:Lipoprotein n=1 Tax=Parashewanella curva TaxID=2338552 RepID=A0A3L8PYV2_9GAMM|nr:hypothetical protein [Parashewanella curva]RLV60646.1 hypothetical protein D5018_05970 [Parashewanella curva]